MKRPLHPELKNALLIIAGLLCCSAAYNLYLIPNSIAAGGFTGIGQLVNRFLPVKVGTVSLILNIPLFALSMTSLGLRFGLRSLIATFGLSLFIDYLPLPAATNDMLLASVFGGVLGGAGFGLIIRGNATTGGTDMLAKLISSRFHSVSLGAVMFAVDGMVIIASAFVFDVVSAMFALISTFLMSKMIDFLVDGLNSARAYFIISDESEKIARRVIDEMERGITGLNGQGMYSGADKKVLLCVISRTESPQLRAIVSDCDPRAFVIATDVHEALGEGFRPMN